MERELLEAFEAARKAADAVGEEVAEVGGEGESPEAARCVDALRRLRGARVTTAALVSTQVGKHIRYLTKHPHSSIKATASDLLGYWKRVVIEEDKKNGAQQNGKSSSTMVKIEKVEPMKIEKSSPRATVIASPRATVKASPKATVKNNDMDICVMNHKSGKDEKVSNAELKTQPVKVEKVQNEVHEVSSVQTVQNGPPRLTSVVKCGDASRDRFRGILGDAFSKVYEETKKDDREEVRNIIDEVEACDPFRVAVIVECALFKKLGSSNGPNKVRYRSLMFNLRDDNNTDFRRRVLIGQVEPERIADLTPAEMASDTRKLQNKKIEEKALFDCERGGAPKATTDQFKCGRCGQRKTTYYQLQTRSADEPMTTFVTCVNCNNHWKFC
uniref:Transcription elongation factor n=1 Tax=Leersia perrieri TaxID=77586 RepID=A0A0D9WWZ1_9ORYZ